MPVISGQQIRRMSRPRLDVGEGVDSSAMIAANVNREPYSPLTRETPSLDAQPAAAPGMPGAAGAATPDAASLEDRLRRVIIETAMQQSQQPVRQQQYPQYQPLERQQTTGFKGRLMGAIEGLAAGYGRTGNWAGALGGAVGGAVNRNAARGQLWQQTVLPQELRRITWQQQQDALNRKQAMDRFKLLTDAANAVRGLRDPNNVYKPVSGSEYATIYNPRTGQYEVLRDSEGQPIEAASIVSGRERNQSQEKQTGARIASQEKQTNARINSQTALQRSRNQTQLTLEGMRGQRQIATKQAEMLSRRPSGDVSVSNEEVQAAKLTNEKLSAMTDEAVRKLIGEQKRQEQQKRGLPNAQGGVDFLSGWEPFNRAVKK